MLLFNKEQHQHGVPDPFPVSGIIKDNKMRKHVTPLERLECEARRLMRLVNEINTGRRSRRVVRIGEVLVREHIRKAHTRICWRKVPGKPVQIKISEQTEF